ncbi:MAG: hypothetical protein AAF494_10460 [Pseudomonadota bacterium]
MDLSSTIQLNLGALLLLSIASMSVGVMLTLALHPARSRPQTARSNPQAGRADADPLDGLFVRDTMRTEIEQIEQPQASERDDQRIHHILRSGTASERREALEQIATVIRRAERDPVVVHEVTRHLAGEGFILLDPTPASQMETKAHCKSVSEAELNEPLLLLPMTGKPALLLLMAPQLPTLKLLAPPAPLEIELKQAA